MRLLLSLFLLSTVCSIPHRAIDMEEEEDYDEFEDIRETISAIDDVISWAKAHHYLLIVDFLFSIRVAQGELSTSQSIGSPERRPSEINMRLQLLQEKIDKLAEISFETPSTKNRYYMKFLPLISRKYNITAHYPSPRNLPTPLPSPQPAVHNEPTYDEADSDRCMVEILGSTETAKCELSEQCYTQMTNDKSEDYQLTHQLIFYFLADMHGCREQIEKLCHSHDTTLDKLIEKFVSKTYQRMPSILDSGRYDLFLEMVLVGRMFNYQEFRQPSIQKLLFLWHQPTGCYNEESKTTKKLKEETKNIGRRLLADELIDDNCSEHMTALALIVLCLTLNQQLSEAPIIMLHSSYSWLLGGVVLFILILYVCFRRRKLRFLRYGLVELLRLSDNR